MTRLEGSNTNVGQYEILWDGNSVWVNAVSCIGRYGKAQGELYYSGHNSGNCVSKELFSDWQRRIQNIFGIQVPDAARPLWG